MSEEDQVLMFNELPMDNPEALKKKRKVNILQDMLIELIQRDGDETAALAKIQKATNIPWGTLYGWYKGDVETQKLDRNILVLAQYFNVTIDYLAFGVGSDEPYYEKE